MPVNTDNFNLNMLELGTKPPIKPKLSKIEQKKKQFEMQQQEANQEIDRMQMVAEDELSMKAEIFNHK